jgi:hypothetical protein
MISSGQPHHRGRKAAVRDERRARRKRVVETRAFSTCSGS